MTRPDKISGPADGAPSITRHEKVEGVGDPGDIVKCRNNKLTDWSRGLVWVAPVYVLLHEMSPRGAIGGLFSPRIVHTYYYASALCVCMRRLRMEACRR